ncbi:MAG: hypothetical protein QGG40_20985, partial [Myxococcota bacterium]|nr:hypothetical protein [Myxococcota bacterium]
MPSLDHDDASQGGTDPRSPGDALADAASTFVLLGTIAAHLTFIRADRRLPADLGRYYTDLPELWEAWGSPAESAGHLLGALAEIGGWYNLLLAGALRFFGRHPAVFQLLDLVSVAAVVLLAAAVARRLGGPVAGLVAASLTAAAPVVVVEGRHAWIHLPEAALVLGALYAWVRDPTLRAPVSRWALAILG